MKLLLRAAIKTRKHFSLACFTVITLIFLTVANNMEMFALGVLANTGSDFFQLFGNTKVVKTSINGEDNISLEQIQKRWKEIDKQNTGRITKRDASQYMALHKKGNPINWILRKVTVHLSVEKNFLPLIIILIVIAVFKAICLFSSRYISQLLAIRVTRDLREQYFEHIQSLPLSFYQEHNMGSLTSRAVGRAHV